MPVISIPPDWRLRENKLYCLEKIAELDVASVLPVPLDYPQQDRQALLNEVQRIDREIEALGADADVTWMAEGFWEATDAEE